MAPIHHSDTTANVAIGRGTPVKGGIRRGKRRDQRERELRSIGSEFGNNGEGQHRRQCRRPPTGLYEQSRDGNFQRNPRNGRVKPVGIKGPAGPGCEQLHGNTERSQNECTDQETPAGRRGAGPGVFRQMAARNATSENLQPAIHSAAQIGRSSTATLT